jgi:hypothetical protein
MTEKIKYAARRIGRVIRSATGLPLPAAMRLGKMCAQSKSITDFMTFPQVSFETHLPFNEDSDAFDVMLVTGPKGIWKRNV